MSREARDVYLNDHLSGATMGCEIADHLAEATRGGPLGDRMDVIAGEIHADRITLEGLAERHGTTRNPVKRAAAWIAEKAGELTFSGVTSGDDDLGLLVELESLSLGVEGKIALWRALKATQAGEPAFAGADFDELIRRGESQRGVLEGARMEVAAGVLA